LVTRLRQGFGGQAGEKPKTAFRAPILDCETSTAGCALGTFDLQLSTFDL